MEGRAVSGTDHLSRSEQLLAAAERAHAEQQGRLLKALADARRLKERGPGSMYSEDEARHMAEGVLELLIETLAALTGEQRP
jgi:hypothetical protein